MQGLGLGLRGVGGSSGSSMEDKGPRHSFWEASDVLGLLGFSGSVGIAGLRSLREGPKGSHSGRTCT